MGSICSTSKSVSSVITCTSRMQLTLTAPAKKPTTISAAPRSYPDLVRLAEYLYHIPAESVVFKGRHNGEEFEVADDHSYAVLIKEGGAGPIEINIEQREARRISEIMPATGVSEEVNGWGILKPVPIDVEIRSDEELLSRKNSMQSGTLQKDAKSYICADGYLLVFDTATKDCFKFLSSSVEESSRAVALSSRMVVVTGGEKTPGQVLKIDMVTGTARQSLPQPHPRHSHASVLFLSSVWVIGGVSPSRSCLASCDFFSSETWQAGPLLNHPRSHLTACVHATSIFVVGGMDQPTIEKMENGRWTVLSAALPWSVSLTGVFAYESESIVIAGGVRFMEGIDLEEVYFLSLATEVLSQGPRLPIPDHFLTAGVSVREGGYLAGAAGRFELQGAEWKMLN